MNLEEVNKVYFIGIGGIGMSSIARYFNILGKQVAGYDRTPTALTNELTKEGIKIHFIDDINQIESDYKNPDEALIIYTPAIPNDSFELNYFKNNNFQVYKRSEVLGMLTGQKKGIAIAGTHGKTSISTILAHILNQTTEKCSAFLGGISKNYESNFLMSKTSDRVIIEADEFDRSFLQLTPKMALISSMDADHLDIYRTRDELVRSFNQFISQIIKNGILIFNKKISNELKIDNTLKSYSYSITEDADYCIKNIRIENNKYTYDIITPDKIIEGIILGLPGKVNVENSIGAAALAKSIGIDDNIIKKAFASYKGVQRRFDIQLETNDIVYIDDYAHHPQELLSTINSIKELYPRKKITGIFQPHLYTRTRDFAEGFAKSLDLLDEIILLDIYPARELPIDGVTSEIIFNKIQNNNKTICTRDELMGIIEKRNFEVLLTLGAGDIDKMVLPIKNYLIRELHLN